MRVFFTLFCEDVSEGSYGRLNFLNILPQKQIVIPQTPYAFHGYIVVALSSDCSDLNKKLNFFKSDGFLISSFDLPTWQNDNLEKSICSPLVWTVDSYGQYALEVLFEDNRDAYRRNFEIIKGPAASFDLEGGNIPSQITLGYNDKAQAEDWFKKIFKKARNSILVIDNFWATNELRYLLTEVKPNVKLILIVKNKKNRLRDAEAVKKIHPNTEIKASSKIHDRYICLDGDSEIWHIGASLSHAGRKVMTINRIVSLNAINKLKDDVNSIFSGII